MYVSKKVKSIENLSKLEAKSNYELTAKIRPKTVSDILKQIEGEANKRPDITIDRSEQTEQVNNNVITLLIIK